MGNLHLMMVDPSQPVKNPCVRCGKEREDQEEIYCKSCRKGVKKIKK